MRTFLSIRREENTKDKYYIAGVINSDMYPSTYASENPDARIVELPDLAIHDCINGYQVENSAKRTQNKETDYERSGGTHHPRK